MPLKKIKNHFRTKEKNQNQKKVVHNIEKPHQNRIKQEVKKNNRRKAFFYEENE